MFKYNEKWLQHKNHEDVKESFCGACLAVPLAFAGVGASAYGADSKSKHKNNKKIMLWVGIITIIISLFIAIYYMFLSGCKNCK